MRLVWLRAVLGALFACTPSLVAVAVLAAHTVRGRPLDLQTALSVVAAVNLLRAPLFSLPLVLQSLQVRVRVRARVSLTLTLTLNLTLTRALTLTLPLTRSRSSSADAARRDVTRSVPTPR